jgi:hypothetical protein
MARREDFRRIGGEEPAPTRLPTRNRADASSLEEIQEAHGDLDR